MLVYGEIFSRSVLDSIKLFIYINKYVWLFTAYRSIVGVDTIEWRAKKVPTKKHWERGFTERLQLRTIIAMLFSCLQIWKYSFLFFNGKGRWS
ncbi:MAG: hypothetical protein JXA44_04985 [Methanospirillaceae archaeon]|nr:hypothetical protein [Methanospirillaceae archaeon]